MMIDHHHYHSHRFLLHAKLRVQSQTLGCSYAIAPLLLPETIGVAAQSTLGARGARHFCAKNMYKKIQLTKCPNFT